jgi:hypothetical protein
MKIIFLLLYGISVFLLSIITYINPDIASRVQNPVFKEVFMFLAQSKFLCVLFFSSYIFVYTILPKWVFSWQEKNKLIKLMMERINTELLGGNLIEHRVTLFKKTNYLGAFFVNIFAIFIHTFHKNCWRTKLYFRFPRWGDYLVIKKRCGMMCEKSTTAFMINKNEYQSNGVASYIACNQTSALIPDLPDINDIDFKDIESLREVKRNRRKEVANYMRESYLRDFTALRLLHQK